MFRRFFWSVSFLVLLSWLPLGNCSAQGYEVKSHIIGAGVGPAIKYGHKSVNLPAMGVKLFYDKGIIDIYPATVMVGLEASFSRLRHETEDSLTIYADPAYTATWSKYIVAARITYYHHAKKLGINNLHIIAGVSLGARFTEFYEKFYMPYPDLAQPADDRTRFHFSGFVGASYHISPQLAAFAHLGYMESWLVVGFQYTPGMKRLLPDL